MKRSKKYLPAMNSPADILYIAIAYPPADILYNHVEKFLDSFHVHIGIRGIIVKRQCFKVNDFR